MAADRAMRCRHLTNGGIQWLRVTPSCEAQDVPWASAKDDGFRFWPPFLTAAEQFVENTSSQRMSLITLLFYGIGPNPAKAPSNNPYGRGSLPQNGQIHRSHAK